MATKAKKTTRPSLALPGTVTGFMNSNQVREALGGIGRRRFAAMLSSGQFPKADMHLGADGVRLHRWSVTKFNQWCEEAVKRGRLENSG